MQRKGRAEAGDIARSNVTATPSPGEKNLLLIHNLDFAPARRHQMVNTRRIPLTFAPEEPNDESLAAISEGNAFLASGKPGRFTSGGDLLEAAMS